MKKDITNIVSWIHGKCSDNIIIIIILLFLGPTIHITYML